MRWLIQALTSNGIFFDLMGFCYFDAYQTIDENHLTGTIPTELGLLASLADLSLGKTHISTHR